MPDDKDWTWVLEQRCEECGFDAQAIKAVDVAPLLRETLNEWRLALTTRSDVRDRPRPDLWSPLEYGCHVRDVFRVYTGRVRRMLDESGPHYANWDQDETAVQDNYPAQDPHGVADQIDVDGTTLANLFDSVHGDQWQRTGFRSDGAAFTIDSISRYFIHDIVHHLYDIGA